MSRLIKYIKKPSLLYWNLAFKGFFKKVPDRIHLERMYRIIFNKKIDIDNPITFNEKLNWLKLNNREEKYTLLADKILVKKYVEETIGTQYVIPLIKVYDKPSDINIDELPEQFVIKCNHDSGGAFICKNKKDFNFKKTKKRLKRNLKRNWFYPIREWPYKNIKPRILVEKYIEDPESSDLIDYKFLCFNGEPKYVYTTVKNSNIYENYYDMNFNIVKVNHGFPRRNPEFKKPSKFNEMVKLVKKLCVNIPFVRIDMHNINGRIYFGEFTFYDWGGMKPYSKEITDLELGKLLDVSKIK